MIQNSKVGENFKLSEIKTTFEAVILQVGFSLDILVVKGYWFAIKFSSGLYNHDHFASMEVAMSDFHFMLLIHLSFLNSHSFVHCNFSKLQVHSILQLQRS